MPRQREATHVCTIEKDRQWFIGRCSCEKWSDMDTDAAALAFLFSEHLAKLKRRTNERDRAEAALRLGFGEAVAELFNALTVGLDGRGGFDPNPMGNPGGYIGDPEVAKAADEAWRAYVESVAVGPDPEDD